MKKYLLLLFLFFNTSVFAGNISRIKEVVIFSQPCFYCEKLNYNFRYTRKKKLQSFITKN